MRVTGISLVLIGVAVWAFVWAVRRGQFENLDAAALDVLVDEVPVAHGGAGPSLRRTPTPTFLPGGEGLQGGNRRDDA